MDLLQRLFNLLVPYPLPVLTTVSPYSPWQTSHDCLLFFRPGVKYRGPWDDAAPETPGDPPVPVEEEQPPLTTLEWAFYLVFGGMVTCTFLALATVIWLGHTPIFAN